MTTVLIVPGLGNSGPDHWQTHLQARLPQARRVEMTDWDRPDLADWMQALEKAVQEAAAERAGQVVLVGHSLGCATIAHWSREGSVAAVRGALLVAPPDVDDQAVVPAEIWGFAPLPRQPLPFPATVVASRNDPYMTFARAEAVAAAWGAPLLDAGEAGHINTASGHGRWDLAERLVAGML
ncbi:alpha/beta hydrolase [Caenispirillum bisanense]|uniref:RBBP9/YdeN family alpha/beta hydrolase n=1 Tax=Caenispirillum bisanense TaxID=414052 RepID=UPI0031E171A6